MKDSLLYRYLRWLNCSRKQTAWRGMLWYCLRLSEDRTRLKQQVRKLEQK